MILQHSLLYVVLRGEIGYQCFRGAKISLLCSSLVALVRCMNEQPENPYILRDLELGLQFWVEVSKVDVQFPPLTGLETPAYLQQNLLPPKLPYFQNQVRAVAVHAVVCAKALPPAETL